MYLFFSFFLSFFWIDLDRFYEGGVIEIRWNCLILVIIIFHYFIS